MRALTGFGKKRAVSKGLEKKTDIGRSDLTECPVGDLRQTRVHGGDKSGDRKAEGCGGRKKERGESRKKKRGIVASNLFPLRLTGVPQRSRRGPWRAGKRGNLKGKRGT